MNLIKKTGICLLPLLYLVASCQKKDVKIEQVLAQLERDWSVAYMKHDTATIRQILAEDYIGTDGRGIISNKADEIVEATESRTGSISSSFVVLDETVVDISARVYGEVAVVNGRVVEKIRTGDKVDEVQYRRTTVWVKRERWQCVSFHGSRIL